jgi:glycerol uptake operon antiterminator
MNTILLKKRKTLGREEFYYRLHHRPVIAAVKSQDGVDESLSLGAEMLFVLFGDILTIPKIVSKIKDAGKIALIHLDLIDGLASREIAVDYLWETTGADGILSTKANLVKHAKNKGFLGIQRFFVLDSLALLNIEKQFPLEYADAVEILPGIMPKIIKKIVPIAQKPVIAGGLITEEEDVRNALEAGAAAVSSSNFTLLRKR